MIEASDSGDELQALQALRTVLAQAIQDASPGLLAPLSKQFREVVARIAELAPVEVKDTPLDELNRRRASRQADPTHSVAARRRGQRG